MNGRGDAGAPLNGAFIWTHQSTENVERVFALPGPIPKALASEDWLQPRDDLAGGELPFELLAELDNYDYWTLYHGDPWERIASNPDEMTLFRHPWLRDLVKLVRTRLVVGLISDPLEALREARHVAALSYSVEWAGTGFAALAVLNDENRAWRKCVENGQIAAADWKPVAPEAIAAAQRVLDQEHPLERHDLARLRRLEAIAARHFDQCDLGPYRQWWDDSGRHPSWLRAADFITHSSHPNPVVEWMIERGEAFPYLRKSVATMAAASAFWLDLSSPSGE